MIRTKRLLLRTPRLEDAPQVHANMQDERLGLYIPGIPWPYSLKAAEVFIAERLQDDPAKKKEFFAERDGVLVASCNYHERTADTAKIGYLVGAGYHGEGIATEMAGGLLEWLIREQGMRRIQAEVYEGNSASMRVLEKLGFTHEGCLREAEEIRGRVLDKHVYGLLAREWKQAT